MAKIFFLHWNETEAKELASGLTTAGHDVTVHWSVQSPPPLKDAPPDIAVISLDRLPSHGRAVAEWLWEAKKRRHIPILFVGGQPAKVEATLAKFPKAFHCPADSMPEMVSELLNSRSGRSDSVPAP